MSFENFEMFFDNNNNKELFMEDNPRRLTRAEKRALKRQNKQSKNVSVQSGYTKPFRLKKITPKTNNQAKVFEQFENGQNILIHGFPGTGKSYISLYLAFRELNEEDSHYKKVIIIRSVVPSRDMGFLPGSIKEKSKIYEDPYVSICADLYGRGDAYDVLCNKKMVEFHTSSFLRGLTFEDCIVIIDECQNMTFAELHTIITRIGENSRLILCGDLGQNDLVYKKSEFTGLIDTMKILDRMRSVSMIEFEAEDIVRSGFVKEYILAKYAHEENMKLQD